MLGNASSAALVALSLAWAVSGCESNDPSAGNPPTYGEMRDRLGFAEAPQQIWSTPEGFIDFFIGPTVLEGMEASGEFIPSDDVDYSMIRMPQWAVDEALRTESPVTLSLCDPANGIVLFNQVTGGIYHALPEGAINCTPWIQHYDGRVTSEYASGHAGVFGFAQTGVLPNGNLYAGAAMEERMEDTCGQGSRSSGGSLLGSLEEDASPDDALLDTCVAPPAMGDGDTW